MERLFFRVLVGLKSRVILRQFTDDRQAEATSRVRELRLKNWDNTDGEKTGPLRWWLRSVREKRLFRETTTRKREFFVETMRPRLQMRAAFDSWACKLRKTQYLEKRLEAYQLRRVVAPLFAGFAEATVTGDDIRAKNAALEGAVG